MLRGTSIQMSNKMTAGVWSKRGSVLLDMAQVTLAKR